MASGQRRRTECSSTPLSPMYKCTFSLPKAPLAVPHQHQGSCHRNEALALNVPNTRVLPSKHRHKDNKLRGLQKSVHTQCETSGRWEISGSFMTQEQGQLLPARALLRTAAPGSSAMQLQVIPVHAEAPEGKQVNT